MTRKHCVFALANHQKHLSVRSALLKRRIRRVHNNLSFLPSPVLLSRNTSTGMLSRCRLNGFQEQPPLDSKQTSHTVTLFLSKHCSLIILVAPEPGLPSPFHFAIFCRFVCLLHCFTSTGEGGFGLGTYWLVAINT